MSEAAPRSVTQAATQAVNDSSATEQAAAAQLLVSSNAALRTFKIHATDNKAVQRPIDSIIESAETLVEARGRVLLAQVERIFYLGETRVRLSGAQQEIADQFAGELYSRGLGGLTFDDVPSQNDLVRLFQVLHGQQVTDESAVEPIRAALREAGVRSVTVSKPQRPITESTEKAPKERAAHVYTAAFEHAKQVQKALESGKPQSGVRSQRIIQELVDLSTGDPRVVLALAGLRGAGDDDAEHSIAVAVLSVALGRRLGLSKVALADLGVAAVYHDTGMRYLDEATAKNDLDIHPVLSVKTLLGREQPDPRVLRQVVVAFEHHLDIGLGGHPPLRFKKRLHPLSQIVRLADDFDLLTRGRYGRQLDVVEAVDQMRRGVGTQYHPGLFEVFQGLVGGEVVDDLEEAEVLPAEELRQPSVAAGIVSRTRTRPGEARDASGVHVEVRQPVSRVPKARPKRPKKVLGALKLKRIRAPSA